jgi:predicted ribosomally synthesized peptide with SipW-like signal peptide
MKKKIFAAAIAVCLIAAAITGATIAYFTDNASVDNTFTIGEVTIKLDESKVTVVDNRAVVSTTERVSTNQDYGYLYPGQTLTKDPTITNTGSEKAFVAAKVTISTTADITDATLTLVKDLLSGGMLLSGSGATCVSALDNGDYVIYILYHGEMSKDQQITMFTTLSIPSSYGNTEMALLKGLKIDVDAYAVQSAGFTNAKDAIEAGFDVFDGKFN